MTDRTITATFLVTGAPGAGKSTFIRSISDVEPHWVSTPQHEAGCIDMTDNGSGVDYGRLSLADQAVLHLYGTPGPRLDQFAPAALGVATVIDTRDLASARATAARVNTLGLPQVVALNTFGRHTPLPDLHDVLDLGADTPVVACDAVDPEAVKEVLMTLLAEILFGMHHAQAGPGGE